MKKENKRRKQSGLRQKCQDDRYGLSVASGLHQIAVRKIKN